MIIKGGSRAGASDLAAHLQRVDTNERMEVLEVRGTVSREVDGALREIEAMSSGTRCKNPLYHASINVPIHERLGIDGRRSDDDLRARMPDNVRHLRSGIRDVGGHCDGTNPNRAKPGKDKLN